MKALSVLNLSAVASVCLGMAFGSANDRAVGQCIRLHPEGGLDPAKPYASAVQAHTHEALTGAGGTFWVTSIKKTPVLTLTPSSCSSCPPPVGATSYAFGIYRQALGCMVRSGNNLSGLPLPRLDLLPTKNDQP
jgi:hypothetical protein